MGLCCQGGETDAVCGENDVDSVVACCAIIFLIAMVVVVQGVGAAWDFVPQGFISHICGFLGRSAGILGSLECRGISLDAYGGIVGCGGWGGTPSAAKVAMVGGERWKNRTEELVGLYVKRM